MQTVALLITRTIDSACYEEISSLVLKVLDDCEIKYITPAFSDFEDFYWQAKRLAKSYDVVAAVQYDLYNRTYNLYYGNMRAVLFDDVWLAIRRKPQDLISVIKYNKADEKKIKLRACDCGLCDRCVGVD